MDFIQTNYLLNKNPMSFFKKFLFFFLLLFLITSVVFFYLEKPVNGIDDGNIFLKYAENIVNGNGFVFNVGSERVEGFTSLLWVLVCAAFYLISSNPEMLLMFFLLILTTLTVTIVYDEVKKDVALLNSFYIKKYFPWLYGAFVVCIGPSFIAWSVLSLMENGVWNFLFISIVVLLLQFDQGEFSLPKKTLLLIIGILLILTRPEAFAWILLFSLLLIMIQKKHKRTLVYPAVFFLVMAFSSLVLTYFRLHYFGYPFPNTYYAKISNSFIYNFVNGLKYAVQFFTTYNPLVTLLFILLVAVSFNKRNLGRAFRVSVINESPVLYRIFIVTVVIACSLLLPFTTGGDHFSGFRFYQSILPLFAWGLPSALWLYHENIKQKNNRNWISLGSIAVLFFLITSGDSLFGLKTAPRAQLNYEFYLATYGRETAKEFSSFWNKKNSPSVGMIAVGGFALKYSGQTVDLMGLNNTLMGHSKGERTGIKNHAAFNKEVFYQLKPDLLLPRKLAKPEDASLCYAEYLNTYNFENRAMKNIFNDSGFQQSYKPVLIQKINMANSFFAFANANFLNKMKADSTAKFTIVKL
jgi:arabinofuranosyltransferase